MHKLNNTHNEISNVEAETKGNIQNTQNTMNSIKQEINNNNNQQLINTEKTTKELSEKHENDENNNNKEKDEENEYVHLTGAWSMHGQGEVLGGLAELSARDIDINNNNNINKINNNNNTLNNNNNNSTLTLPPWMSFTQCQWSELSSIPSRTRVCSAISGFNWAELKQNIRQNMHSFVEKDRKKAEEMKAFWSPTVYFNGKENVWEREMCNWIYLFIYKYIIINI